MNLHLNPEEYRADDSRKLPSISYLMPAYNCASTVEESVESIMDGNFVEGDELIITNDCSTDQTAEVLSRLQEKYPVMILIHHARNKGCSASRNTAADRAGNPLFFSLDSDNILLPSSVMELKRFLIEHKTDVASFGRLSYFKDKEKTITHEWVFGKGEVTLADHLSKKRVPGASGNYLFTKESWLRAGGYAEFAGGLDAWGFALRQLATGSKMMAMPDSSYLHRYGHDSLWVRDYKKGKTSLVALQILLPFIDQIAEEDVDYIMGPEGRYHWFEELEKRPVRVRGQLPNLRYQPEVIGQSRSYGMMGGLLQKVRHGMRAVAQSFK